jgi:hypothetical protein
MNKLPPSCKFHNLRIWISTERPEEPELINFAYAIDKDKRIQFYVSTTIQYLADWELDFEYGMSTYQQLKNFLTETYPEVTGFRMATYIIR